MFSLWFSNQERKERIKHCCYLLIFFICLSTLLICWIVPTLANSSDTSSFSRIFSSLKGQTSLTQTFKYLGLTILTTVSLAFIYGSIKEIFSLITPPSQYKRAKRYHWIFTVLTLAPLFCTLSIEKKEQQWDISNSTHYLFFQLYFFIANRIAWKFFIKFLLPDITEESSLIIKKVGGKLTRQHYLGWTAFFLLAFYLPVWALLLIVAISFFNNSFSFVFGRRLGSTRLSDYSPTKTLEGSICSTLLSIVFFSALSIALFMTGWFDKGGFKDRDIWFYVFVVLLIGAVSILSNWGDCTFSLCKRALGYKNFGRLFGVKVGGFWDRFDSLSSSLFFTSIAFWGTLVGLRGGLDFPIT